jgi:hypothetical protein
VLALPGGGGGGGAVPIDAAMGLMVAAAGQLAATPASAKRSRPSHPDRPAVIDLRSDTVTKPTEVRPCRTSLAHHVIVTHYLRVQNACG